MKTLFLPITPFITHPERIAAVALFFFAAAAFIWIRSRKVSFAVLFAGLGWTLFVIWEGYCNARGYDIRVDLFLIYPVLLVLTLWGILETVAPGVTTRPIQTRFSLQAMMIVITLVAVIMGIIAWLAG
jgi:hypothetical protein